MYCLYTIYRPTVYRSKDMHVDQSSMSGWIAEPADVRYRFVDDAVAFAPARRLTASIRRCATSTFTQENISDRLSRAKVLKYCNESQTCARVDFYSSDMFVLPILRRTCYFISYRLLKQLWYITQDIPFIILCYILFWGILSFFRSKGGGTEIHHVLCVGFGWGIICLRDLPAIYQAPSLYCQKNIKLIILGKSCFTQGCNFLNGSRDATACSEMSRSSTRCSSILIGQAVRPMGVAPPANNTAIVAYQNQHS